MTNIPSIIIDAGHGGFDPGGGSNSSFKEKDKNLQISTYQKRRFDELGIPSILVRTTDETLDPNQRINRILSLSRDPNDILISNHINSGNSSGGEIIYSIRSDKALPNIIGSTLSGAGLPLRNVYQRVGKTGKDYYFILRDTPFNKAMIIEYGFATDEKDTKRLNESWQELAEAVVKGIAQYLNIPYTKPKYTTYVVNKDDSLYKIARKYNTTIDSIINLNSLSNTIILPGQTLLIPYA